VAPLARGAGFETGPTRPPGRRRGQVQRLGRPAERPRGRSHRRRPPPAPGPRPVYRDPDLGVLVYEYLDADIASDANGDIEAIGGLLRAIHALPPIEYRLDPLDRARRYLGLCGNGTPSRTFVDACRRLSSAPGTAALCHNDPLRANRIPRGGRLLAIDWEYAAMGDPMFDLAAIVEGDGLTEEQARQLLESWLDAPARNRHRERLADNRLVYRELSRLWRAAVES